MRPIAQVVVIAFWLVLVLVVVVEARDRKPGRVAPLVRLVRQQASTIRKQQHLIYKQEALVRLYKRHLQEARSDALLLASVRDPVDAYELLVQQHQIRGLDEVEP